jgi:hypothetical protein
VRVPILGGLGWLLVAEDPVTPADAIVLTVDVGAAGVLEASDLVHAGIASRVVVFADAPTAVDVEFMRRGYKVDTKAAIWLRMLAALGVGQTDQIPLSVTGTQAETELLPDWCDRHSVKSLIVVSAPDHARRVRRTLHRSMNGRSVRVMVRPARVSTFEPDRWWQTRDGLRVGLVELEKLLLDFVRHPLS